MFFFASFQTTVVLLLLGCKTTLGLPKCEARCTNKKTKIYKQAADGTCVPKCLGDVVFRKRFVPNGYVPQGYICGACPERDPSRYNTNIEVSRVPANLRSVFTDAAKRWEQVITGDLPEWDAHAAYVRKYSNCFPYVPHVIDDLFICASAVFIDGPKGILGSGGPEWARFDLNTNLPTIGFMRFDKDDLEYLLSKGVLDKVILHEMGHVFGIGTLWEGDHLLTNCVYAADTQATAEWQAFSGCTSVIPVETDYGPGTACSHWDEACLQGELMTGFLSGGLELSRMTVGTLEDLGYTVDYSAADEFLPNQANSSCICTGRRLNGVPTINKHYSPKDRKLSGAQQNAIAYGEKLLVESAARAQSIAVTEGLAAASSYVGDKEVFILYLEDDESVHSIAVRAEV